MRPDVSILLVTFRCREAALACLRSIYATTSGVDFEVVVLDNASDDGTVELVASEFPQARLIASTENLGFARGVNRAAEESTGEFVLLLNPDTEVHPGAIERIVAFAGGPSRARPLRREDARSRRQGQPGLVLGGADALEPLLLRRAPLDRVQAQPGFRSGVARRLAAGHASARSTSSPVACCSPPGRSGRSWAGSTLASSCTGRTPTSPFAPRRSATGRRSRPTPSSRTRSGVSSATREDKLLLLFSGKATLLRKHWRGPRLRAGLFLLKAGVGARALLAVLGRRSEGRAGAWPEVWRERRDWLPGYPPRIDAPDASAPLPSREVGAA